MESAGGRIWREGGAGVTTPGPPSRQDDGTNKRTLKSTSSQKNTLENEQTVQKKGLSAARGTIVIPEEELQWQFVRSQGPGGQHVNRASTKAVLRFHVVGSPSLSAAVRARLLEQQRSRLTDAGDLVITSQRFREQPRNIADCLDKLREMLERAAQRPRPRRPTRPTKGSVARRRLTKQRRSETKKLRRPPENARAEKKLFRMRCGRRKRASCSHSRRESAAGLGGGALVY